MSQQTYIVKNRMYFRYLLLFVAAVVSIVLIQLSIGGNRASAVATPEVCFTFDTVAKSITSYENPGGTNNCPTDVVIPDTIGGVPVEAVGPSSFSGMGLTSVVLPNSLKTIGDAAFSWNQLTSVTIPNGIVEMPAYGFEGNWLTTISLPASVVAIKSHAFSSNKISSISLSESIVEIGMNAFYGNRLTSVTLPSSLLRLDSGAFAYNAIEEVTLPSQLAYTGYDAETYWEGTIPEIYASPRAFNGQSANPDAGYTTRYVGVKVFPNCPALDNQYLDSRNNKTTQQMCEELLATRFWYVRVKTVPGNPNQYPSWVGIRTDSTHAVTGGHIVNPAKAQIAYSDTSGNSILAPKIAVGTRSDGLYISDYFVDNGPAIPVPEYPYSPTPAEQQAIDLALAEYYRVGESHTFLPERIAGYISPAPQTVSSMSKSNDISFVYGQAVRSVPFLVHTVRDGNLAPSSVPSGVSPNIIASSSLAIGETGSNPATGCDTISSANLLAPSTLVSPSAAVTILGGLQFALKCTTGAQTKVTYTLGSSLADTSKLHIYKRNNVLKTTEDITSQVSISTASGKTVITYSIVDGGPLDEDGQANGTIIDPIYVGLNSDAAELAATGTNAAPLVIAASALVVVGTSVVVFVARRSRQK